jgi:hypothetical protein
MNRSEAKDLLPIIQAFVEGRKIEYRELGEEHWSGTSTPTFDIESNEYRIKSEPKYRPFKDAVECWQEIQKHQPFGWIKASHGYFNIIGIMDDRINFGTKENWLDYEYMFKMYKFIDGTPFGIKEE